MQPIASIDTGKDNHEMQYDRSVSTAFKNLSFGSTDSSTGALELDNMSGYWWTGTSTSAMAITHNFGHPAIGFLVVNKNGACDVWQTASTNTQIGLAASVSGITLTIFVLG